LLIHNPYFGTAFIGNSCFLSLFHFHRNPCFFHCSNFLKFLVILLFQFLIVFCICSLFVEFLGPIVHFLEILISLHYLLFRIVPCCSFSKVIIQLLLCLVIKKKIESFNFYFLSAMHGIQSKEKYFLYKMSCE
jgi:hypothetical protein